MTWLGVFNFLLLQWFFIRLAKEVDTGTKKLIRWSILRRVIPLTGWWTSYRYIGKKGGKIDRWFDLIIIIVILIIVVFFIIIW